MDRYEEALVVDRWEDLKRFGIQILTGEACGIGMRILCDLSEKGVQLLEEFLGNCLSLTRGSNWNSMVEKDEAVASIMLLPSILRDLAAFCLLKDGFNVVAVDAIGSARHAAIGFKVTEKQTLEQYMEAMCLTRGENFRTYHVWGTCGTRNRHMMSGRVA